MTIEEMQRLKRGDQVRVKDFGPAYDGKVVTILKQDPEGFVASKRTQHPKDWKVEPGVIAVPPLGPCRCVCTCGREKMLGLSAHNLEYVG